MPTQTSILLVHEEPLEGEAVREALRSASPGSQITVAESQSAALALLAAGKFDCVICQARTGPEESVNFLTEVWNRAPGSGRFVIAPSIDPETQIRCAFAAHHFLPTPLDLQAVSAALATLQTKDAILPNDRVQFLISRMRSLPSKPALYFDVLRELDSRDASARAVATLIEKDAGITSKLIQVVNSIFYGRAEATHETEEAVLFLGFEVTASIVLSLEAISRFEKVAAVHHLSEQVWAHSQTLAELSRRIAQGLGLTRRDCDRAYLAGLLHDLGKLVLAQNFSAECQTISKIVAAENRPPLEVEREVLGLTHADAGGYLLAVWGLPVEIVEAVAAHHAVPGAPHDPSLFTSLQIAEEVLESEKPLDEIIAGYPPELGLLEHKETFTALAGTRGGLALSTRANVSTARV